MDGSEQDARWQDLLLMRAQFEEDESASPGPAASPGPIPEVRHSRPHKSRRAARFDEALSGWTGWSSVEAPPRRLSA